MLCLLIRPAVGAAIMAFITSCGAVDSSPPWDTAQMVGDLTAELRKFEGLTADFDQVEVLAWRVDSRGNGGPRLEIALFWGRTGPADAPAAWALVQGYRHPQDDSQWHRSLVITEPKQAPLAHPKPGEDPYGTWHAYQRYDHPPTVREICDFAAVDFLNEHGDYRRVSGELRKRAWLRVAGELPPCGFAS